MPSANDPEHLTAPARARLDGWKEIAAYFGRGVRTVQRWETELRLPVRRIDTGRGQVVYALVEELDRWRELADAKKAESEPVGEDGDGNGHTETDKGRDDSDTSLPAEETEPSPALPKLTSEPIPIARIATIPTRRAWRRGRVAASIAAVVLVVAAVSIVGWRSCAGSGSRGQPASARVVDDALTVYDASGRVLWEKRFDFRLTEAAYAASLPGWRAQSPIIIDDVDGDGKAEVLFVAEPYLPSGQGLFCFNADGSLRFQHVPTRVVVFGKNTYAPPWSGASVYTSGAKGRPHDIWFVSAHPVEFPTLLEKLDGAGNIRGEYWSNGRISYVVTGEVGGRSLVFVGAISNEFKGGSLAVLDSRRPYGSAPALLDHWRCKGCPTGSPLAFIVFPRLDVTAAIDSHSHVSYIFPDKADQIQVGVFHDVGEYVPQELRSNATTHYHLNSQFHVTEAELGEGLQSIHDLFQRKELLFHPFSREYDAQFLWPVRRWEGSTFVEITRPEASGKQ